MAPELDTRLDESGIEILKTKSYERKLRKRIGKFEVVSHVATGGFGEVYRAKDPVLQVDVAIKIPRMDRMNDKQIVDFLDEARTMAKLDHPNIVPIKEIEKDENGVWFIVMKWVQGNTLAQFSRSGKLNQKCLIAIIKQVADALQFAHSRGIYHRDLKPANILIDRDNTPLVSDFGLALNESDQSGARNQLAGTLPYMSPEQVKGHAHFLDGRTDIWSLGVILYELLTERRPFTGNKRQLFEEILERDPKPPRQINAEIPQKLEEISLRCLEKDPKDRYLTAADISEALRIAIPDRSTASPEKLRNKLALAVLAAVPLLLLTLIWNPWAPNPDSSNEISQSVQDEQPIGQVVPKVIATGTQLRFKNGLFGITVPKGRSLYSFGTTEDGNEQIQLSFSEIGGRGIIGLYWGLDDNRFQFLMIDQEKNFPDKINISRHVADFDSKIGYQQAFPAGHVDVDISKHKPLEHTVIITLKGKSLFEISVNGKPLAQLVQEELSANNMGEYGIFVSYSDTVFSNLVVNGESYAFTPSQ